MSYSTLAMVKKRFPQMKAEDWTEDDNTELEECITTVDAEIDIYIKNYVSAPLTEPPQIIKDISADLAAWEYGKRRPGVLAPEITFREEALQRLEKYIEETYLGVDAFRKVDKLED